MYRKYKVRIRYELPPCYRVRIIKCCPLGKFYGVRYWDNDLKVWKHGIQCDGIPNHKWYEYGCSKGIREPNHLCDCIEDAIARNNFWEIRRNEYGMEEIEDLYSIEEVKDWLEQNPQRILDHNIQEDEWFQAYLDRLSKES